MNLNLINKLGPKNQKILNQLNIYTIENLLEYYPYRYSKIVFSNISNFSNNLIYTKVKIVSKPMVSYIRKNLNKLSFKVLENNEIINVVIFNRAFYKDTLHINDIVILNGKYNNLTKNFTASDIIHDIKENSILSFYHLTNGITNKYITKYIQEALKSNYEIIDKIPGYLNQKYNFINKKDAINNIHSPNNIQELKKAKIKLKYEELFEYMVKVNFIKENHECEKKTKKEVDKDAIENFINNLPFTPTEDQQNTFNEITNDFASRKKMNRLILGDVGSGKTLIANFSIYLNFLAGYQSALMAPTEILAMQHYENLNNFFKPYKINVEIITGKMSKKEKECIKKRLLNNEIDLLIGTHSLITNDVVFYNLGLVITDEEHRFGVIQRKNLENKGINVDCLYLSATPIPRTYAKIIHKDLDISIIKTKPLGRKDIKTKIIKNDEILFMLKKIFLEIKNKHQVFVVAPAIDNETNEIESVNLLKEKYELAFKNNARIETIHGQMKNNEKDAIMHEFIIGNIDILISTTVIEVGIDVSNASVIAIYNAERFGLATLHQLRGRVGRSDIQSFCFLVSDKDNKRLKVMEESNDGFYITEMDYKMRKEGDIFGTLQSGIKKFKIADLETDYKILLQASEDADEFVKEKKYQDNTYYLSIKESLKEFI